MILTSHSELEDTDNTTGVWIGEFTDPYYIFLDKGFQVALASPMGGKPPIDPMSKLTEHITSSNRRFQDDSAAQQIFGNTLKLDEVSSADYDAVFFPGGHGPLFDLAHDEICGSLILDFLTDNKPVASVCHGPAALLKAAEMRPNLLKGKRLTGFSNTEEKLALRIDNIPYTLEDRMKKLGADYHTAALPFIANTEMDGLLITGQNPMSAGPTAKILINFLED